MPAEFLLRDFVIVLAAAIVIIVLSRRVKLPVVAGFMLTGILIGPSAAGLVRDTPAIDFLAQLGVVMLLFLVGLEFSFSRLRQIQRFLWVGGGTQVVLTVAAAGGILLWAGRSLAESVFAGFLVALSSTAVVLKLYTDRNEINSPQGRISTGILLFQDLAVVPMAALIPLLSPATAGPFGPTALRFAVSLGVITAVFVAGLWLFPRALDLVVKARVREINVIAVLFLCLGMALLAGRLGFSLALGAFLAGVILSESPYSLQAASDILPFKDLFNSLFFISIGMLLNLRTAWDQRGLIVAAVLSILVLKSLLAFLTVRILKYPGRTAMRAGLPLAQIGEFSFVLASAGKLAGLIPESTFQVFIAASILTILLAPSMFQLSTLLADSLGRPAEAASAGAAAVPETETPLSGHVIIAGFGLNGQNVARVLKETGIPYVIVELDPQAVKDIRGEGRPVLFGDISRPEVLKAAGIERAKAVVFAISDPPTTRRAVRAARSLSRQAFLIVRTRFAAEIDDLFALGADSVVPQEFETSIEIFARTLEEFHIPANIVAAQVRLLREERYGVLRGIAPRRPSLERISELLNAGTTETYFVAEGSRACGQTIRELKLRSETGAMIIAVVRGERSFTSPPTDFQILGGDTLVLVANHQDMDRAFGFLDQSQT